MIHESRVDVEPAASPEHLQQHPEVVLGCHKPEAALEAPLGAEATPLLRPPSQAVEQQEVRAYAVKLGWYSLLFIGLFGAALIGAIFVPSFHFFLCACICLGVLAVGNFGLFAVGMYVTRPSNTIHDVAQWKRRVNVIKHGWEFLSFLLAFAISLDQTITAPDPSYHAYDVASCVVCSLGCVGSFLVFVASVHELMWPEQHTRR
jgi:hypothetical protein